jgi:outer membrane lipoprotein-sorting protein
VKESPMAAWVGRATRLVFLTCLAGAALLPAIGQRGWGATQAHGAPNTDEVMRQLDREAKDLHSLTADIERTTVTVVVNDKSTESGKIFMRTDEKMRIELTKPDQRTILRNGDKVWHYLPKTKRVEEYDIGKYGALADSLLTVGLGSSGTSLKKHYLVTVLGVESLENHKTVLLELVPKDEKFRSQIARVQLWVDTGTWLAIQQKFFETGSGDYIVINYRNVATNMKMPENDFKPHWPRDVTVVKPQSDNAGL